MEPKPNPNKIQIMHKYENNTQDHGKDFDTE